jgi:serine/threonine-protein kinase PknK
MDRLEAEQDNIRAALRWVIDQQDAERSVRFTGALWSFWDKRGHRAEAVHWLSTALAMPGQSSPAGRARALIGLAMMHRARSAFAVAEHYGRQAVALLVELGDPLSLGAGLAMLADMVALAGDPSQGAALAAQAATLRQEDAHALARSLVSWGYIKAYQAEFHAAAGLFRAALELRHGESGTEMDSMFFAADGQESLSSLESLIRMCFAAKPHPRICT